MFVESTPTSLESVSQIEMLYSKLKHKAWGAASVGGTTKYFSFFSDGQSLTLALIQCKEIQIHQEGENS